MARNISELRGYLEKLLTSPDERHRMGLESLRIVAKHGVDATLDKYLMLYDRAIASVKGA